MEQRRAALRATIAVTLAGAALAAVPGMAQAAGWKGVVVAKDPARKVVVTASQGGTVRTVRAGARVAVGARVTVQAAAMADGTFRGQQMRVADAPRARPSAAC